MTDVGTLTVTDFVLARIAEDEAVARAALAWQRADPADRWRDADGAVEDGQGQTLAGYVGDDVAPHIARWDPARVLAECEAKRRIVDSWVAADHAAGAYPGTLAGVGQGLDVALQFLALPYADHPDYREAWRP